MKRRHDKKGAPTVYFPQGDWDRGALPTAETNELVQLARAKLKFKKEGDQQFPWRGWLVCCHVIHAGWVDIVGFDCQKTGIRTCGLEHVYCGEECQP